MESEVRLDEPSPYMALISPSSVVMRIRLSSGFQKTKARFGGSPKIELENLIRKMNDGSSPL
jgi:hypothetical protein